MSALLGATVTLLGPVTAAQAAPVVISHVDNTMQLDVVQPADCVGGTEHLVGPERVFGQVVEHPDGSFSFVGNLTDDLTVQFSNGWTGVYATKEHFTLHFFANGNE